MSRGGQRSTSFRPGQSGNPAGRPLKPAAIEAQKVQADVKVLARECAPDAVSTLRTIMLDAKAPPAARIGAANALLDRGYGKPCQAVEVDVRKPPDYSRLTDEELITFDELLAKVA